MSKFTNVFNIMGEIYPEVDMIVKDFAPYTVRVSLVTTAGSYQKDFYIPEDRSAGEEVTLIINDIIRTINTKETDHTRIPEFDLLPHVVMRDNK